MYQKKTKKINPNKSKTNIIWLVIDESGSMMSVREQTVSAYNEYIDGLQSKLGNSPKNRMGITIFSDPDKIRTGPAVPLSEMGHLNDQNYKPNGCTALYDAIASGVRAIESELESIRGDVSVIFIIQTDGQENSSKEMTQRGIFDMIEQRKKKGNWTFVFLGADQDAFAAGGRMGIPTGNTLSYKSADFRRKTMPRIELATIDGCLSVVGSSTDNFFGKSPLIPGEADEDQKKKVKPLDKR